MSGIDQLLDAYESSGGGKPAAPAAAGIDALLDAYERPRTRPQEPRAAEPSGPTEPMRIVVRRPQQRTEFEPGMRTEPGGPALPAAVSAIGDATESAIRGAASFVGGLGAPGRIAVNAAREVEPLAKGAVQAPLQVVDALIEPSRRLITDTMQMRGQQEQAAAIGVSPERVRTSPLAPLPAEQPATTIAKDFATGMQRRHIDAPGAPDRGQPTMRGWLDDINPPAPGEKVGLARQEEEPLSTLFDALVVVGMGFRKVPRRPNAATFDAARAARAEDVTAGRIARGVERGEARRAAPAEPPPVRIEAVQAERAATVAADRAVKTRADAVTAGLRFNAQRIAAEAERAEAVSPEAVGARVTERGAARAARRADVERARNKTWTANEIRDAEGVDFGTAQRIAARRNEKVAKARELAEITPGTEAVVRVGDQTFRITKTHSHDPILRREINDAVRAARGEGAAQSAPAAPVGVARPRGGRPAPMFKDAVTGREYAAKFTGAAKDSPIEIDRAARLERRRRVKALRTKEVGSTPIINEAIDAAARAADATYNRTIDIISASARLAGKNVGRATAPYTYAMTRPAAIRARRLMEAPFDAAARGIKDASVATLRELDLRAPNAAAAARAVGRVWKNTLEGSSVYEPEVYKKAKRIQQTRVIEPRLQKIETATRLLEKVDPDTIKALFYERSDIDPKIVSFMDPDAQKLVNDARPAFRVLSELLEELGWRESWHGRITNHTRDYMGPSFFPRHMAQAGRQAVSAGLAERGVLKSMAGKGPTRIKGRTRTDLEFFASDGQRRDLAFHVLEEIRRRNEHLDKLDVLAEVMHDPQFGVPVRHIVNEKDLRVRQDVHLTNAKADGARTLADALSSVDTKIDALINRRMEINADLGADPSTRARLTPEVNRLDKEWNALATQWEDLAALANEGIADIDTGRAHVSKEIATLEARIADMPNEVARLSQQTGIDYIPIREAFRRIGKAYPDDVTAERLGMARDGWVNPDLADSGALEILVANPSEAIGRNTDAALGMWKFMRTVGNERSWVNNALGGSMLAAIGRFPLSAQPLFVGEALSNILGNAQRVIVAREAGLNMNPRILATDVRKRLARLREGEVTPTALENASRMMRDARWARGYRIIDDAVRMGMWEYGQRVRGMTPEAAAEWANHWVLDPADKPRNLRILESSKLSAILPPFLSIYLQSIPRVLEGAIKNPLMVAALGTMSWSTQWLAQQLGAMTERDADLRNRSRPLGERIEIVTVPHKADNGAVIEHNMGGWNPATGLFNIAIRGDAGPLTGVINAFTNAPNPETGLPSPNPGRRAFAETVGPTAGRMHDIVEASTPSRSRLDENREVITPGAALTKALVPVNYRAASTTTVRRQAYARAQGAVSEARRQFNKLAPSARRDPANLAKLREDIRAAWRDNGFANGDPEAPAPSSGGPIDYTRPIRIGQ